MTMNARRVLLSFSFLISVSLATGQEVIVLDEVESDIKREEIQRYFGYDNTFTNYATLPYDTCIGVNEKGKFVDLGYYMIALIPLMWMLGFLYRRRFLFFAIGIVMILYLAFAMSNSLILDSTYAYHEPDKTEWKNFYNRDNLSWDQWILARTYQASSFISAPMNNLLKKNEVLNARGTYLVLFLMFILALFAVLKKDAFTLEKIIYLTILIYGFYWLILSGGIVWYGFLLIPLALAIIGYKLKQYEKDSSSSHAVMRFLTWSSLIIWALLIFVTRISNINVSRQLPEEHLGKTIVESNLFYYATGLLDADQTLDNSFRNISNALKTINATDEFIFMVGTSFSFDIVDNQRRIFFDNTLANFLTLRKEFVDKRVLADAFKASGFRYIVVDLNTNTLDQTPEKSLTQKFKILLEFLYLNPKLELIATDRVVEYADANGNTRRKEDVFGKIVHRGSYAIYEIL